MEAHLDVSQFDSVTRCNTYRLLAAHIVLLFELTVFNYLPVLPSLRRTYSPSYLIPFPL